MCTAWWRAALGDEWQALQCPLSARLLFDEYAANHRARQVLLSVKQGACEVRRVSGEVMGAWRWCPVQQAAVQELGLAL